MTGLQFTITATAAAGGTFQSGVFQYLGKEYCFISYGGAYGLEGGLGFSSFSLKVAPDFDPITDFGGRSRANSISLGILSYSGTRPVSFNHSRNLYIANDRYNEDSFGFGFGVLKVGYSHSRTNTVVWEVKIKSTTSSYEQALYNELTGIW